jgi:antibiotic biosynthesis monooxygenase (ABM) superfamily enzyme
MRNRRPSQPVTMKKFLVTLLAVGLLAGAATVSAAEKETKTPMSVIHVVTVSWKEGTKPEQIQAALDGVKAMPAKYPGMTRVWVKSFKVQGDKSHAFVMEFKDRAAFNAYTDSPAQLEWYKTYLPIRESSAAFDITN